MSEFKSLRKNWEFHAVYRNGKSKANRCFVMIIKKNDISSNRVGISVSKKVGNSIVRHRVTRVIREVMRLHWGEIKSGYDIVIVARPSAKDSDYGKFESAIFSFVEFTSFIERRRFGMKIILIKIIRFYQKYLSALKGRATCIYTPTCSQYAIEAIEKHGVLKGDC